MIPRVVDTERIGDPERIVEVADLDLGEVRRLKIGALTPTRERMVTVADDPEPADRLGML